MEKKYIVRLSKKPQKFILFKLYNFQIIISSLCPDFNTESQLHFHNNIATLTVYKGPLKYILLIWIVLTLRPRLYHAATMSTPRYKQHLCFCNPPISFPTLSATRAGCVPGEFILDDFCKGCTASLLVNTSNSKLIFRRRAVWSKVFIISLQGYFGVPLLVGVKIRNTILVFNILLSEGLLEPNYYFAFVNVPWSEE